MNILFLDIDCPLKSGRAFAFLKPHVDRGNWDNLSVQAVNMICEKTNAKIVFSSTWNAMGLEELTKVAQAQGITGHIVGITEFPNLDYRLDAIKLWLQEHQYVERWVCLDDVTLQHDHCLKVDFNSGISYQNYSDAIRLLGGTVGELVDVSC